MSRLRPVLATAAGLLALCACSGPGHDSPPAPGPGTGTASAASPSPTGSASSTGAAATTPSGTPTGTPAAAARSADPGPEPRVSELSTGGGVASVEVRLTTAGTVSTSGTASATGTASGPRTAVLAPGETLRLVVTSPIATHLTGAGLGVDIDIPAGSPTAVDVVTFTAGSYVITSRPGAVVLKVTVRG